MAIKDKTRTKDHKLHYTNQEAYNNWCREFGVGRLYVEPTNYYHQGHWHIQQPRPQSWLGRFLHWLIG